MLKISSKRERTSSLHRECTVYVCVVVFRVETEDILTVVV